MNLFPSYTHQHLQVIHLYSKHESNGIFLSLVYNQGIYDPNNFFPLSKISMPSLFL